MRKLIREIHRRSLWQVLGIYLAGSWVALQVVEQLAEAAGLPDWVRLARDPAGDRVKKRRLRKIHS